MCLICVPTLEVLLETKALGSTKWLPALQRISPFLPVLAFFGPGIVLLIALLISLIHPIAFPPSLILLVPLLLIVVGAIWLSILVYVPSNLWGLKLNELRRLMTGDDSSRDRLMVVALHYRLVGTGLRAIIGSFYDSVIKDVKPRWDRDSHLMIVPNIGMLEELWIGNDLESALSGVVFFVPQEQLERARPWELKLLCDWTINVYRHSSLPVWVVADWVEDTAVKSAALRENIKLVNSLLPYVTGIEKNLQADPLVIIRNPPKAISDCLTANALALRTKQQIVTLDGAIQQAFTPVASLLRQVFGYSNLFDRLDALLRATEFSISYFSLVLTIEIQEEIREYPVSEQQRLQRLLTSLNRPLTFGSWETSLVALANRSRSPMANTIRQLLQAPAINQAKELKHSLMTIGGSVGDEHTPVNQRRDTLTLLRKLRNVTTGHGPATERISSDLYTGTLAAVIDFISSLPWSAVSVQYISTNGLALTFCGCLPQEQLVNKQAGTYLVILKDPLPAAELNASSYFKYVEETRSIALFVGSDGYFDPLSGIRLPA